MRIWPYYKGEIKIKGLLTHNVNCWNLKNLIFFEDHWNELQLVLLKFIIHTLKLQPDFIPDATIFMVEEDLPASIKHVITLWVESSRIIFSTIEKIRVRISIHIFGKKKKGSISWPPHSFQLRTICANLPICLMSTETLLGDKKETCTILWCAETKLKLRLSQLKLLQSPRFVSYYGHCMFDSLDISLLGMILLIGQLYSIYNCNKFRIKHWYWNMRGQKKKKMIFLLSVVKYDSIIVLCFRSSYQFRASLVKVER